jgi:hypothetical protein
MSENSPAIPADIPQEVWLMQWMQLPLDRRLTVWKSARLKGRFGRYFASTWSKSTTTQGLSRLADRMTTVGVRLLISQSLATAWRLSTLGRRRKSFGEGVWALRFTAAPAFTQPGRATQEYLKLADLLDSGLVKLAYVGLAR